MPSIKSTSRPPSTSTGPAFLETRTDPNGKERKVYHDETMMPSYEKLKALPKAEDYLKPGIAFEIRDATAHRLSDNQAPALLQKARQ